MFLNDANGAVTTAPIPAALGTEGWFSPGNPGTGQKATQVSLDWLNSLQGNLVLLQKIPGIADSKTDFTQLYQAVLSCARLVDAGAVNALAATPALPGWAALPALAAISDGFTVKVTPAYSNTAINPTFAFNGGAALGITDPLGGGLQPLDIVAGMPCELMKLGGATPFWALLRRAAHRLALGTALSIAVNPSSGIAAPTLAQILNGSAAFNSPQNARNWAQANLDLAGQSVTYNIAGALTAGLTAIGPLVGQSGPGSEVFSFASGATLAVANGTGLAFQQGAQATVQGSGTPAVISASGTGANQGLGLIADDPGTVIVVNNINFGSCGVSDVYIEDGGMLGLETITKSGNSPSHIYAHAGSRVIGPGNLTLAGTPNFATAFVILYASYGEIVGASFSGSATGARFLESGNSVLNTNGSSPSSYLPGNAAGTKNDNSVYL